MSKYYKLGVSDCKMAILGCNIGVKDNRHFYDMACDFKHEQVRVKLTRAQSINLKANKTDRLQQKSNDGAMLSNNTELTVEINHPSSAISCPSTFKLPSSTSTSFVSSEFTISSECSAELRLQVQVTTPH